MNTETQRYRDLFSLSLCVSVFNKKAQIKLYLAKLTARVSRMTVIFTCPG